MKLGYVILYVPDVGQAIEFYESAFSLKRKFVHESGQYGELSTGATTLAFASRALGDSHGFRCRFSSPSDEPFGIEIALVCEDVPTAMKSAIAKGATLAASAETKPWGQIVGYVRDLNGFLVELCTAVS